MKKFQSKCIVCGKEFESDSIQEFCSDECRKEYARRTNTDGYIHNLKVNIPKRYIKVETSYTEHLNSILTSDDSFYIYGKAGVGKTVLAYSVYKNMLLKHKAVRFISFSRFIFELQRKYNQNDDPYSYADSIGQFNGALIMDDIGGERITDFIKSTLFLLVEYRYNNMLKTIFTSNHSLSQLENIFNDRIVSRIGGMCKVIEIKGKDRRV